MTNEPRHDKALRAMTALNAAIRNLQLYPVSSAPAENAVKKAFQAVLICLEGEDRIVFAESEKRLVVGETPLTEKDRARAQVTAFLQLLLDYDIKTLTFQKGVEPDEFSEFLGLFYIDSLGSPPRESFRKSLEGRNFRHITVNNSEWMSVEKGKLHTARTDVNVTQSFGPMVNTLDFLLADEIKDPVSRHIASSIATKHETLITDVLTQQVHGEMGRKLFNHIIDELDGDRFDRVMMHIRTLQAGIADGSSTLSPDGVTALKSAYQTMIETPEGKRFEEKLKAQQALREEQHKKDAAHLRKGLFSIINEERWAFTDEKVMAFLPGAVQKLLDASQEKAAETFLDRMAFALSSTDATVRRNVAAALSRILETIRFEHRNGLMKRLISDISRWIRSETEATPSYSIIVSHLEPLGRSMVVSGQISEVLPVLEALRDGRDGGAGTNADVAGRALQAIATEEAQDRLMTEFISEDTDRRNMSVHCLFLLGQTVVPRLLSRLKSTGDPYERSRALALVMEIGASAVPAIMSHLEMGGPWYFLRNLIRLMGKIGDASCGPIVAAHLQGGDIRVQRECLNTLFLIGGDRREDFFMAALTTADPSLVADVIRILGRLGCRKAVPGLMAFLSPKSVKARPREAVAACLALGDIGDPAAFSALKAWVAPKKGILGMSPQKDPLVQAARKAMALLVEKRTKENRFRGP